MSSSQSPAIDPSILVNVCTILNSFVPFAGPTTYPSSSGNGYSNAAAEVRGCTCKKSLCLNLYCQCFAAKMYCSQQGGMCKVSEAH